MNSLKSFFTKRYLLWTLSIISLGSGIFFLAFLGSTVNKAVGAIFILISALFFKASRLAQEKTNLESSAVQLVGENGMQPPSIYWWILALLALAATLWAYNYLYLSAQHGYQSVVPVYVFAVVAVCATIIWATFAAKLFGSSSS